MKANQLLKLAVYVAALFITVQNADATIWRVNNNSNYNGTSLFGENLGGTINYPVYKQINDAAAATNSTVKSGDTLYVEGSPSTYSGATITKKLVIIGNGYFLTENVKTSTNLYASEVSYVYFNTGSAGSQLIGMTVTGSNSVDVNVDDVVIKRCKLHYRIALDYRIVSVYILQNLFTTSTSNALSLSTNGVPSNIVFNNNIVQRPLNTRVSNTQYNIKQCNNNVFDGPANGLAIDIATSEFKNNILKASGATVNINSNTNNNVSYATGTNVNQFAGTPNAVVANMNNVFQTTATSTDGKYQLQAAWATANPGTNGERGVFGGAESQRYTLSGLATIPTVYEFSTTGVVVPGSGLPVNIKARTIK